MKPESTMIETAPSGERRVEPYNEMASTTGNAGVNDRYLYDPEHQVHVQLDWEEARMLLADDGKDLRARLCRQLSLAHEVAEKFLHRGMAEHHTVEAARLVNAACRLMSVYQQGMLVLRHLQSGNDQRITVQQVNVSGGNALVAANVRTAGAPPPAVPGAEDN